MSSNSAQANYNDAKSSANSAANDVKSSAKSAANDVKAEAKNVTSNETQSQARQTKDSIGQAANDVGKLASSLAGDAKDSAERTADEIAAAANDAKQAAKQNAHEAKENVKEVGHEAKSKAIEVKDNFVQRLREDGVVNPNGLGFILFGAAFLAAVPVTSFLASSPTGLLARSVNGLATGIVRLGSGGSIQTIAPTATIAALSTLYVTFTYAITGANSAAGQAAGRAEGRDNKTPRANTSELRGLPLRLFSAHYNLLEMFPSFALTAALAQSIAPTDQTLISLLGLHVIAKVFVYYPAYIFNIDALRSAAHVIATASVMNVGLRLARKPLLGA